MNEQPKTAEWVKYKITFLPRQTSMIISAPSVETALLATGWRVNGDEMPAQPKLKKLCDIKELSKETIIIETKGYIPAKTEHKCKWCEGPIFKMKYDSKPTTVDKQTGKLVPTEGPDITYEYAFCGWCGIRYSLKDLEDLKPMNNLK